MKREWLRRTRIAAQLGLVFGLIAGVAEGVVQWIFAPLSLALLGFALYAGWKWRNAVIEGLD